MKAINFLRSQREKIRQKAQRLFYLQITAIAFLVIYALIVAGTFSYYFILTKESQNLDQKITLQKTRVGSNINVETRQFFLKRKVQDLEEIFKTARNHQTTVEGFFTLLGEGIEVKGFSLSEEGQISLNGYAIDFLSLKNFLENIKRAKLGEQKIYTATVNKVSLSEKPGFSFSITLYLNPPVVKKKAT